MINKCILFFFTCIFLTTSDAQACTTFCVNPGGQTIVGTNFDFIEGNGYIFTNKKGVSNFFTHKQEVKHGLLLSDSFMKKAIINKQKSLRAFVHSNRKNVGYSQSIEINQLREGNI